MNKSESIPRSRSIVRKGRLNGAQRNRLRRLLNMMYTTNELAIEVGVSQGMYKKRSPAKDEAFCLKCGDVVKMVDPAPKELNGLSYVVAKCSYCGRNVARFMDMVRKNS